MNPDAADGSFFVDFVMLDHRLSLPRLPSKIRPAFAVAEVHIFPRRIGREQFGEAGILDM